MKRIAQCVLMAVVACVLWGGSGALAAEPGPGWVIRSRAVPTYFAVEPASGFADGYNLEVRNAGSRATNGSPVTVTDVLGSGVTATAISGYDARPGGSVKPAALECSLATVSCTDTGTVLPGDVLYVSVTLSVSAGVQEGSSVGGVASVSGGGSASASITQSTLVSSEQAPFGIESLATEASGVDGLPDDQAGDHPYEFTTRYYLNTNVHSGTFTYGVPAEDPKDFVVDLPAGFVGDPQVVQKCDQNLAQESACPASSQIGVATIELLGLKHYADPGEYPSKGIPIGYAVVPIYNVVPAKGVAGAVHVRDLQRAGDVVCHCQPGHELCCAGCGEGHSAGQGHGCFDDVLRLAV